MSVSRLRVYQDKLLKFVGSPVLCSSIWKTRNLRIAVMASLSALENYDVPAVRGALGGIADWSSARRERLEPLVYKGKKREP